MYPVHKFNGEPESSVGIPAGSKFMTLYPLQDGIYAHYLIPEVNLDGAIPEIDEYFIPGKDSSIDLDKYEYVDSVDIYVQNQGIMIFHVFRKKK